MDDFLQYWEGTEYKSSQPTSPMTTSEKKEMEQVLEKDDPFLLDVTALYGKYGFLIPGKTIETTLRDLLLICPRKRERSDAYVPLMKHLKERYGVELEIIKQRKHEGKD